MSSLADSEATLSERARTYGLLAVTGSDGIKTYSALLFSVASAPEMSISPGTCLRRAPSWLPNQELCAGRFCQAPTHKSGRADCLLCVPSLGLGL